MNTAEAIKHVFVSPNVPDDNCEPANLVDVIHNLGRQARQIAHAITPPAAPGPCPSGDGHVGSLTEAMMGVTSGLMKIAEAINSLADAISSQGQT